MVYTEALNKLQKEIDASPRIDISQTLEDKPFVNSDILDPNKLPENSYTLTVHSNYPKVALQAVHNLIDDVLGMTAWNYYLNSGKLRANLNALDADTYALKIIDENTKNLAQILIDFIENNPIDPATFPNYMTTRYLTHIQEELTHIKDILTCRLAVYKAHLPESITIATTQITHKKKYVSQWETKENELLAPLHQWSAKETVFHAFLKKIKNEPLSGTDALQKEFEDLKESYNTFKNYEIYSTEEITNYFETLNKDIQTLTLEESVITSPFINQLIEEKIPDNWQELYNQVPENNFLIEETIKTSLNLKPRLDAFIETLKKEHGKLITINDLLLNKIEKLLVSRNQKEHEFQSTKNTLTDLNITQVKLPNFLRQTENLEFSIVGEITPQTYSFLTEFQRNLEEAIEKNKLDQAQLIKIHTAYPDTELDTECQKKLVKCREILSLHASNLNPLKDIIRQTKETLIAQSEEIRNTHISDIHAKIQATKKEIQEIEDIFPTKKLLQYNDDFNIKTIQLNNEFDLQFAELDKKFNPLKIKRERLELFKRYITIIGNNVFFPITKITKEELIRNLGESDELKLLIDDVFNEAIKEQGFLGIKLRTSKPRSEPTKKLIELITNNYQVSKEKKLLTRIEGLKKERSELTVKKDNLLRELIKNQDDNEEKYQQIQSQKKPLECKKRLYEFSLTIYSYEDEYNEFAKALHEYISQLENGTLKTTPRLASHHVNTMKQKLSGYIEQLTSTAIIQEINELNEVTNAIPEIKEKHAQSDELAHLNAKRLRLLENLRNIIGLPIKRALLLLDLEEDLRPVYLNNENSMVLLAWEEEFKDIKLLSIYLRTTNENPDFINDLLKKNQLLIYLNARKENPELFQLIDSSLLSLYIQEISDQSERLQTVPKEIINAYLMIKRDEEQLLNFLDNDLLPLYIEEKAQNNDLFREIYEPYHPSNYIDGMAKPNKNDDILNIYLKTKADEPHIFTTYTDQKLILSYLRVKKNHPNLELPNDLSLLYLKMEHQIHELTVFNEKISSIYNTGAGIPEGVLSAEGEKLLLDIQNFSKNLEDFSKNERLFEKNDSLDQLYAEEKKQTVQLKIIHQILWENLPADKKEEFALPKRVVVIHDNLKDTGTNNNTNNKPDHFTLFRHIRNVKTKKVHGSYHNVLFSKYFGTDAKKEPCLFKHYLYERAHTYWVSDLLQSLFIIRLCFGIETEATQRKKYIAELKTTYEVGNKDELDKKIKEGCIRFSPRSGNFHNPDKNSLIAILKNFQADYQKEFSPELDDEPTGSLDILYIKKPIS